MGRILVIDDESNIITVLSDILRDEGHEVFRFRKLRPAFSKTATRKQTRLT